MNKNSLIYIAGHTGLIGSSISRLLQKRGYKNILVKTHKQLDLTNQKDVRGFFSRHKPEYVFLAAAKTGGIYANNEYPAEFIYQNLMIETNIIDSAYRSGAKKLLYPVSSCVYPKYAAQPMKENYILTGALEATNEPFALAKLAGLKMCQSYKRQYGASFISVIGASIYGINDHFDENAHVLSSLIKKFHEAKTNNLPEVVIWGSGRPKREFLYVDDYSDACLYLMEHYDSEGPINIGAEVETSISQLARIIGEVIGFKGKIKYDPSKPDGNPRRALDSSKIHKLGWMPKIKLKEGVGLTYDWFRMSKGKKKI